MTKGTVVVCCWLALLVLIVQGIYGETGLFVHITDSHYDALYKEGATILQTEPKGEKCGCRIIDPTVPKNQTSGKFGTIGGFCDVPLELIDSAAQFIAKFSPKPDFILYGGDNNAHDFLNQTPEHIGYAMSNISTTFKKHFLGNIPVFPVLGNHESFPIDQLTLDYGTNKWLMEPNFNFWVDFLKTYLDQENLENFKNKGYYTLQIIPGLRLLAINSMLHMTKNIFVKYLPSSSDPFGQIAFIDKTLGIAQKKGEKVILLGHVPPTYDSGDGNNELLEPFMVKFTALMAKYQQTIIGQYYGHTHFHSFVLGRNTTSGVATSVAQITSSLTTWSTVNPGFKIFVYDKQDFRILDSWFMYTDLKKSNTRGSLVWERLSAFSDESKWGDSFKKFGGLTVEAFQDFANRMEENEKGAWDIYSKMFRMGGARPQPFDKKNKSICRRLCTIQFSSKDLFQKCVQKCPDTK